MKVVICKNCGNVDEFEPDEFGLSYYQAIGECPNCQRPTYYESGEPTKVVIVFKCKAE